MPIDFNPHIFHTPQVQIVNRQYSVYQQPSKDMFVKSEDSNYVGVKIEKKNFGKIKKTGEVAKLYTITNKNGACVSLSTFGATITGIKVPDKDGKLIDVTQGYKSVTPYEEFPIGHAGGTIGPYANKISGGRFVLNGEEYFLECNKDNGKSHSHGAQEGFDIQNWKAKPVKGGVEFSYLKQEEGSQYPGNVSVKVTYMLDNTNSLHIKYSATTDKDTILNLTNHSYFNLDGAENAVEDSVLNHIVEFPNSTKVTAVNDIGIPTGQFLSVENTPFDFTKPMRIGDVINFDNEQMKITKGFDQNYCIDNYDGKTLIEVAKVKGANSGIELKVRTNLPGFQFYTANNLGKPAQPLGKDGLKYEKRSGFCVEPQIYPNAINTEEFEEKGILRVGEEFNREIIYSFSVVE